MPKFAANLTMLFNESPFLERFEQAKLAGFDAVEYLFPYNWGAKELAERLKKHELKQVLFNLPPGDWESGERGIACHPNRVDEFKQGIDQAIYYAETLGVKQLNCLSGLQSDIPAELAQETLLTNLSYAADQLAQHQLTLLVEPINSRVDMPGFFLDTLDKALNCLHTLNKPNLKVQFDLYHMQIMQGDLIRSLEQHLPDIAHIQFADNPGRHEPGTGEINFSNVFRRLDEIGYSGYVSAEYLPKSQTVAGLGWLQTFN